MAKQSKLLVQIMLFDLLPVSQKPFAAWNTQQKWATNVEMKNNTKFWMVNENEL